MCVTRRAPLRIATPCKPADGKQRNARTSTTRSRPVRVAASYVPCKRAGVGTSGVSRPLSVSR
eukprot:1176481-Prorocentrum_minimum.AAC.1